MVKKYQVINEVNLRTTVEVDGKRVGIKFSGGRLTTDGGIAEFGTFSTSDTKLQNAIENDSGFNRAFICKTIVAKKEPKSDKDALINDRQKVKGVTNTQMAIEWIEANTDHRFDEVPKKDDVLAVASSLNLYFADWR